MIRFVKRFLRASLTAHMSALDALFLMVVVAPVSDALRSQLGLLWTLVIVLPVALIFAIISSALDHWSQGWKL